MQKRFGGIVRVVQGIKTNVDALEKRNVPKELDEVQEILDAQKIIDEVIVANTEAILLYHLRCFCGTVIGTNRSRL